MNREEVQGLFDLYQKELTQDLQLNEINVKEKQMILPSLKHKWVARLIKHKKDIKKLEREKQSLIKKAVDKAKEKIPGAPEVIITNRFLSKSPSIFDLEETLEELELIVQYLEKTEQIFKNLTYDIKNLIDLIKLETL